VVPLGRATTVAVEKDTGLHENCTIQADKYTSPAAQLLRLFGRKADFHCGNLRRDFARFRIRTASLPPTPCGHCHGSAKVRERPP